MPYNLAPWETPDNIYGKLKFNRAQNDLSLWFDTEKDFSR